MITIQHHQGYVSGDFDMAIDDFVYACGEAKPNYPLPAIPLEVGIHPTFVDVCAYTPSHHLPFRQHWHKVAEWLK